MPVLRIVPLSRSQMVEFVAIHHRHHRPPQGDKFRVGVTSDGTLVGVAVVGRPVSRHLDDGTALEITRICTLPDCPKNAVSMMVGRLCRASEAVGYSDIYTYILDSEHGTSMLASGFTNQGEAGGGQWSCESRPRRVSETPQKKQRFHKKLNP